MFLEIDRLCDSVPGEAMRRLDSIDPKPLSERDLNRYRLLWIKSRDKAYVNHTSDTLILDVIDYYDRHRNDGLYPEALYYGGRVYSDLGDLPTALDFFQKSLEEIPEDDAHLRFKSTVLNQTGRLLHKLRLDSEAIDYFKESLRIDSVVHGKPYNIAFSHILAGATLRCLKDMKNARKHIDEAVRTSYILLEEDRLSVLTEFAKMFLHEGKADSALMVIRPLPMLVDSITTPTCLAVAAETYCALGIKDTAYYYARKLTRLNAPQNKRTGYKVIFSDKLRDYVPKDTLLKLMPEYKRTVEDYLNTHEAEQAIFQNSRYNYALHVKEREKAENQLQSIKKVLWIGGVVFAIIILTYLCLMWRRKYRKSRNDSQIMEGMILAERLKEEYTILPSKKIDENEICAVPDEALEAKRRILEDIRNSRERNPSESVSKKLQETPLYKDLKEKAENKKVMGRNVSWREIEELIESISPGFDDRLSILTGVQVSLAERRIAYLMKFGFTQTQMASLMAKSPSTISAQRSSLANKIGYDKSVIASIIVRL